MRLVTQTASLRETAIAYLHICDYYGHMKLLELVFCFVRHDPPTIDIASMV